MCGYAYSQGNLSSQFRIDLKWNSLIPISEFDKLSSLLNFAFENENNNACLVIKNFDKFIKKIEELPDNE